MLPTPPIATKSVAGFKPKGVAQSILEAPDSPDTFDATT